MRFVHDGRRIRAGLLTCGLVVTVVGLPASAYAESARYDFKIQTLTAGSYHRFPGSPDSDRTSEGSASGSISSDATGSDCSAAYGYKFKRNINNFPDTTVYTVERRAYCSGVQSASVRLTKGHKYYFTVVPLRLAPVVNSDVYVRWSD